jgi:hypothetical protein
MEHAHVHRITYAATKAGVWSRFCTCRSDLSCHHGELRFAIVGKSLTRSFAGCNALLVLGCLLVWQRVAPQRPQASGIFIGQGFRGRIYASAVHDLPHPLLALLGASFRVAHHGPGTVDE